MYYIYEIPGVKIGVTKNLSRRQKELVKKGNLVFLETHTDIYKVSDREIELQKEKGYKVDKQPYWYVTLVKHPKTQTKESIRKKVKNTDYKAIAAKRDSKAAAAKRDYYESRKNLFKAVLAISPTGKRYTFESVKRASEDLTKNFNIKFSRQAISQVANPNCSRCKTYRKFSFNYI